jgi:hypothetical protein
LAIKKLPLLTILYHDIACANALNRDRGYSIAAENRTIKIEHSRGVSTVCLSGDASQEARSKKQEARSKKQEASRK